MNTTFMNSESTITSNAHRILLNLTDKIELTRKDKYIALSNLSTYYAWKNIKKSYKKNKSKISGQSWNKYLIDYILYQIFKIFLNIY